MHSENSIMRPKIDFAFKKIMANPKALKGFLGAALYIPPDSIKSTVLKNINLKKRMRTKNKAFLMLSLL